MPLAPPVTSATRPENRSCVAHRSQLKPKSRRSELRSRPATTRSARGGPTSSRRPAACRSTRSRSTRSAPGALDAGEIRATPETLRLQAAVARAAGRAQLADEPRARGRARRRSRRPLLEIYTALRPRRSTAARARGVGGAARGLRRDADGRVRARGGRGVRGAGAARRWRSRALRVARDARAAPRAARLAAARSSASSRRTGRTTRSPSSSSRTASSRGWTGATPPTSTSSTASSSRTGSTSTSPPRRWRSTTLELARMLVDVDVPRAELVRLSRGLTPAKLARVIGLARPGRADARAEEAPRPARSREPGARDEPQGEPGAARRRRRRGGAARLRRDRDDGRRRPLRAAERDRAPRRLADRAARA